MILFYYINGKGIIMIILLLLMINIPIQGIMRLFYFINFLTRFRGLFLQGFWTVGILFLFSIFVELEWQNFLDVPLQYLICSSSRSFSQHWGRFHRNKGPRWSHWFRDSRIAYLTNKAILEHVGIPRNFRWPWNFLIFPAVLLHFKYQFCCASVRIPFEISGTRLSSSSCSERYLRAPVSGRKAVRRDWGWGWCWQRIFPMDLGMKWLTNLE